MGLLRCPARVRATLVLLCGVLLCVPWPAQGQETPEIESFMYVSTDAGGAEALTFGLDPDATDGIDSQFGEAELPPPPPAGVFDARWVDDGIEPSSFGQGLRVDIRQGSGSSNGTRQHKIQFQSEDAATEVTFEWDLPAGVTGAIEVDGDSVEMVGNDSLTVSPGAPDALLTIDYNAPPTLDTNAGITLDEGGQVSIPTDSLSASDPDHAPSSITFTVTAGPTEGALLVGGTTATEFTQQDLIDGNVAYNHTADIPPGDVPPNDALTFDLKDGRGEGPTGNVFSISVRGTNDPPTVTSDTDTTQQGTPFSTSAPGLLENDSDPNGDPLSVSKVNGNASDVGQEVTLASGALLTVEADGAYSYDPNGAFDGLGGGDTGSDSFTYTASDGNGGTGQGSVTVTIQGGNGAPTAADDSFSAYEDSTLNVDAPGLLENDDDPDGDPLTASVVSPPSSGTLTLNSDGSFEYVPAPEFESPISFTYAIADGNGGTDQATVTLDVLGVRTLSLDEGWNLLSIPYEPEDPTFGAVLPSCASGFRFDPGSGNQPIADGDTLAAGEGFWANCSSGTVQVIGQRADSQTVSVADGWNIIGPFADSIDTGSITAEPSGIVVSSFYRFSSSDGYTSVTTLAPGRGYWVNVGEAGTLTLDGGGGSTLTAGARAQATGTGAQTATLQVTDGQGRTATLWLRRGDPLAKAGRHSLPPIPPGGTFDVRFANGGALATWTPGPDDAPLRTVQLQGVEAPVTLRLQDGAAGEAVRVQTARSADAAGTTLTPAAPSMTLEESPDQLRMGLQDVPGRFSLHPSVPNPAREQATITFNVPKQARVEVALFDVLGRRIRTLTDTERSPGQHDVRLEVQSLPSGTYFYRLSADGFSQTRRLQIVR